MASPITFSEVTNVRIRAESSSAPSPRCFLLPPSPPRAPRRWCRAVARDDLPPAPRGVRGPHTQSWDGRAAVGRGAESTLLLRFAP